MIFEILQIVFWLLLAIGVPVAALALVIIAFVRSRKVGPLTRRIEQLEAAVRALEEDSARRGRSTAAAEVVFEERPVEVVAEAGQTPFAPAAPRQREPIQWELLIGRRGLGWVAVVLLVFATAFFLRYAIENQWIGPLGRVAIGVAGGLALIVGGGSYHRRGWRVFSQMLTAAGVVVLYLSTYAAFGFYRLLPQEAAGVFLAIIVIESAALAVSYDSAAVALVAVLGGLATPVLMHSEHDRYVELFTYLAVLDLGVVLLALFRPWKAIGTVALVGTQALFWAWYTGNYHPEKLAWAIGFQAAVYVLFLTHSLALHLLARRRVDWEDTLRMVLTASFGFAAVYILLEEDYGDWMGVAAIGMAVIYACLARVMLTARPLKTGPVVTALAIASGFVALAWPIQGNAAWVALGWAVEAAMLWWFGQRINNVPLRAIGGALASMAVVRLLASDLPEDIRQPFVPLLNSFALPALGVAVSILATVASTRRFLARRGTTERVLAGIASVVGILLLWFILSIECFDFFEALAVERQYDTINWLRIGQTSLSILWAVFATVLLVLGFRLRQTWLRWLAIALYGVTVAKVFLFDMAELDEIYRILAFFVLAVFLGLAARAYQRIRLESERPEGED